MGGLGNGRRGGRSPPLLIGALIACILVLGFNYWVSSSRNLELQTKLYEMEGAARRGASERGAVEVKKKEFQEEVQRQKEQISRIESLYKKQLEGSQSTCSQERGLLQLNISISTKAIKELKVQLNRLNEDLEKTQKDGQSCRGDLNTLNKKLTYEMTQCNTQILAERELCEEKVSAVKLEVQKKMEKLTSPVSSQANTSPILKVSSEKVGVVDQEEPGKAGLDDTKMPLVIGPAPEPSQPKAIAVEPQAPELLTNEIVVHSGPEAPVSPKGPSRIETGVVKPSADVEEDQDLPAGGAVGQKGAVQLLKKNRTEDKVMEVLDAHGGVTPPEDTDADDILLTQGNGEMAKVDEPEDYDADEQIVGGADLDKRNQLADKIDAARELEEELADYNGDDENEGEFEADKQAELARI